MYVGSDVICSSSPNNSNKVVVLPVPGQRVSEQPLVLVEDSADLIVCKDHNNCQTYVRWLCRTLRYCSL